LPIPSLLFAQREERNMPEIVEGDIVRLKSGSPKMAVEEVTSAKVWCVWIDESGNDHRASFSPHVLYKCEPDDQLGFSNPRPRR